MPERPTTDQLSILDIRRGTTVDGPGFRTSIYTAGCVHHCPGCHNPESWAIEHGTPTPLSEIMDVIVSESFANVTLSGGDPLYQVETVTTLCKLIKSETSKTIWCYTGSRVEQVMSSPRLSMILPYIDVLVDGPFVEALKDEDLLFRGSSNQRLIDVSATLRTGMVVEWHPD